MLNLTIYHEHVSKISSIATQDKQAQRQCTQCEMILSKSSSFHQTLARKYNFFV